MRGDCITVLAIALTVGLPSCDLLPQREDHARAPVVVEWAVVIGNEADEYVVGCSRTASGGVLIATASLDPEKDVHDAYLCRIDSDGRLLWRKRIGKEERCIIHGATEAIDQDIVVVGTSRFPVDAGAPSLHVIWFSETGGYRWSKTYNAGETTVRGASCVAALPNGNVVAGGWAPLPDGGAAPGLIEIDDGGNVVREFVADTSGQWAVFEWVHVTGGYITAGGFVEDEQGRDLVLSQFRLDGVQIWARRYSSKAAANLIAVVPTHSGGWQIVGSYGPLGTVKVTGLDAMGILDWEQEFEHGVHDAAPGPFGCMLVTAEPHDETKEDFLLIGVSDRGVVLWEWNLDVGGSDMVARIVGDAESWYVLGRTDAVVKGDDDVVVAKLRVSPSKGIRRRNEACFELTPYKQPETEEAPISGSRGIIRGVDSANKLMLIEMLCGDVRDLIPGNTVSITTNGVYIGVATIQRVRNNEVAVRFDELKGDEVEVGAKCGVDTER